MDMTDATRGPRLAARTRRLTVSPTVAVSARARALRESGVRVLDFTVGEPDQPTPPEVVAAAEAALDAGRTKYAPAAGLSELRAAVARRYLKDFQLALAPENVVVTVGCKQGLALVYQALLDRDSEVVVPIPAWPTFTEAVRIAGGAPVLLPLRERTGFHLRARAVAKVLSPRTRMVVVNSPSNPTGAIVAPEELLAIARLARRHDFWLLYDDTYSRLAFGLSGLASLQPIADAAAGRLVIVGSVSKCYCMTGWRIGWVIASRPLAEACAALNSHSVQSPATFAQVAAAVALTGPQDSVRSLLAEFQRRRDLLHPKLAALPGVTCVLPEGAFYLFPNVSARLGDDLPDTVTFCTELLEEKSVAVVPGEGFHAPGFLRLSFASPLADLQEGARRFAEFVAERPRRGRRR
jgi:aspartate aminotransferase